MKRTSKSYKRKPDLILTADWHLREDTPVCRTDDFWQAQWSKVDQIAKLQDKFNCVVVIAGDVFHHWKPSPYLLSTTIDNFPGNYVVAGQHDLPQHNLELAKKSGLYTLFKAGRIWIWLDEGNFGQDIGELPGMYSKKIGVWHKFVWDGKNIPWPDCDEMTARQVLKKYPEFDLIVTGDHHKPFIHEYKGRLLVNPGCITRQAADYADHKPRVYLWYADDNTAEPYYLQAEQGVVTRQHIEEKEKMDKRIEAFVSRLSDDFEVAISFEENLKRFFSSNRVNDEVKKLVYKAIEQ